MQTDRGIFPDPHFSNDIGIMNDIEQIRKIRSQTLALLAEVTGAPKPTYSVDGQSVAWNDYLKQLCETVTWCDTRLDNEEPFEFRTQAGVR